MTSNMKHLLLLGCTLLAITGCDKLTDTSRAAQSVTKKAFEDTKSSWRDMFTYHPPAEAQLPQTRYCYQAQSDIVCYDSEQRHLTSKMVGYQYGDEVAWVQPGGGSTGASGGEPEALRPQRASKGKAHTEMQQQGESYSVDTSPIDTGPSYQANPSHREAWTYDKGTDTYRKTSQAVMNDAVSVSDLPVGQ